jgi:hypothetical protein
LSLLFSEIPANQISPATLIEIDNGQSGREKQVIETLLVNAAQAQQEAGRRGALWSQRRETWRFDAMLPGLRVRIGERIMIDIADAVSKTGTVVGWSKRPDRKQTEIEVLI